VNSSRIARKSCWRRLVVMAHCSLALLCACSGGEKVYYAIERSGVVLGYLETEVSPGDSLAGTPTIVHSRMRNRLTLLGQNMDVVVEAERHAEVTTDRTLSMEFEVRTGRAIAGARCTFAADTLYYTTQPGGETRSLVLDADVYRGDSMDFTFLTRLHPGDDALTQRSIDCLRGNIHTRSFTPVSAETLLVEGKSYDCLVFEVVNETVGVASRMWVERSTGVLIRDLSPDGSSMTISDARVRSRVQRTDVDDLILVKVNADIGNIAGIESMTVKARIRTMGQRITAESLNRPGQVFTGNVEGNVVDGVFSMQVQRYDGEGAPAFPPPVSAELQEYLRPELAIESNDAAIIAKARELTVDAQDSWDAVRKLSTFVATQIGGAIPGGGSAKGTLELGAAECGGHSRLLAALSRAVGIPARTVMGGMYTSLKGGSFGQHMWDEVHMGDAGWIAVDATAGEVDYIDAGHIRLGLFATFQPLEMEVLEYEAIDPPDSLAASPAM